MTEACAGINENKNLKIRHFNTDIQHTFPQYHHQLEAWCLCPTKHVLFEHFLKCKQNVPKLSCSKDSIQENLRQRKSGENVGSVMKVGNTLFFFQITTFYTFRTKLDAHTKIQPIIYTRLSWKFPVHSLEKKKRSHVYMYILNFHCWKAEFLTS